MSEDLDRYYSQPVILPAIMLLILCLWLLGGAVYSLWPDWQHHSFSWWDWWEFLFSVCCLALYIRTAYQEWKKHHPKDTNYQNQTEMTS